MNSVTDSLNSHWTKYWSQGNLTSLPCGFTANYDGEFLEFWQLQFAMLADRAVVLDVCSGNGSIALLARDYALRHSLDISVKAVDAADIDLTRVIERHPQLGQHAQAIQFLPGTLLEDVAEAPESIDLVTSQYGVEYTDWRASADNIVRMLRPGGHFSMVCHDLNSKVTREMERQQAGYAQLVDVGLFSSVDEPDPSPEKFSQQLEETCAELYELFQRDRSSQLFSAAGQRLEDIRKLTLQADEAGRKAFVAFREGIYISYGIANDLLAVNRALGQSPDWYQVFVDAGLVLTGTSIVHYHTGENAGTGMQFSKPA
jgi:ubiquinone/menaquinone biosynthesis C-methylase UbiE